MFYWAVPKCTRQSRKVCHRARGGKDRIQFQTFSIAIMERSRNLISAVVSIFHHFASISMKMTRQYLSQKSFLNSVRWTKSRSTTAHLTWNYRSKIDTPATLTSFARSRVNHALGNVFTATMKLKSKTKNCQNLERGSSLIPKRRFKS